MKKKIKHKQPKNLTGFINPKTLNYDWTIGCLKEPWYEKRARITKEMKFRRIGHLNINLLKSFLKKLPKSDSGIIGIYVNSSGEDKGKLAPIHSNGWLLAPMIHDNYTKDVADADEGVINCDSVPKKTGRKK